MNEQILIIVAALILNTVLMGQLLLMAGVTVEHRPFLRFLFCMAHALLSVIIFATAKELIQ